MTEYASTLQRKGLRIGLVPTMGYLHEGHLSLVRLLDGKCDVKGASIFVNPLQFSAGEDLEKYPRDESGDLVLLADAGCDFAFCLDAAEMYPPDFQTYIEVEELSKPLCGRFRPGHFRGVATIVNRLFTLTRCGVAAFGLKDYQQALIISQMVKDLNLPVELVFGETLREKDGMAMSSRNAYLSAEERVIANHIPKSLEWARRQSEQGLNECSLLLDGMAMILNPAAGVQIQYLEAVDPETLQPRTEVGDAVQILLAVFVGKTRLLDNIRIGSGSGTKPIAGVEV